MGTCENEDSRNGYTTRIQFGCGYLYLTINLDDRGQPAQVLSQLGKAGCCQKALMDGLLRQLNMHLDDGKPLEDIIHNLVGIRCAEGIEEAGRLSCADAIGHALKVYVGKEST
jgi:ribonucleoside-diphosphate reductase alpha chain